VIEQKINEFFLMPSLLVLERAGGVGYCQPFSDFFLSGQFCACIFLSY
jgi:hypothetical protein